MSRPRSREAIEHDLATAGPGELDGIKRPAFLYTAGMFSFGPYWRRQSPTQTLGDAVSEAHSGQLWGRAPRPNSGGLPVPAARAWSGPLPDEVQGIEFWAEATPTRQWGGPKSHWLWEWGWPGVLEIDEGTVAINIEVVRINQSRER